MNLLSYLCLLSSVNKHFSSRLPLVMITRGIELPPNTSHINGHSPRINIHIPQMKGQSPYIYIRSSLINNWSPTPSFSLSTSMVSPPHPQSHRSHQCSVPAHQRSLPPHQQSVPLTPTISPPTSMVGHPTSTVCPPTSTVSPPISTVGSPTSFSL